MVPRPKVGGDSIYTLFHGPPYAKVYFPQIWGNPNAPFQALPTTLIPKKEKVVDYHEVHVIGLVHTKPNSINGLPPFMLNRNQVVTVNPPKKKKKPKNSFVVVP